MRRDRLTFAMMIGVPIMQLVLFGYAINMDPKALPAAVVSADSSPFSRSLVRALENTGYFNVVAQPRDRGRGRRAARAAARCSSCCTSPRISRASCSAASAPAVLVEADATDPAATGNALAALQQVEHHGPRPRPHRAARARCKARPGALRDPRAPALQPRGHHAVQHRAGPDGRGAHDDDGDDDLDRDDARARARHDGEPARHAGAPARGDAGQDRALHRRGLRAGGRDPDRGEVPVRRADGGQPRCCSPRC